MYLTLKNISVMEFEAAGTGLVDENIFFLSGRGTLNVQ
jgi:hypothetical protein